MKRLQPFRTEIVEWGYQRMTDFCRAHNMKPVWIFLPATDEGEVEPKQYEEQRGIAERAGFEIVSLQGVYGAGDTSHLWLAPMTAIPTSRAII